MENCSQKRATKSIQVQLRSNQTRVFEDPEPYKQFLSALSRATFLTANSVD